MSDPRRVATRRPLERLYRNPTPITGMCVVCALRFVFRRGERGGISGEAVDEHGVGIGSKAFSYLPVDGLLLEADHVERRL